MSERPFHFEGADIGRITLPTASPSHRTGVIWLNAGAIRRTGPFRLHVHAARHFAELGFPTLRIDQPGLGDNLASARRRPLDIAKDVLDQFIAVSGCEQVVVGGICSAADFAWQWAPDERRVAGLLLLDPMARRNTFGFRLGQLQLLLHLGPRAWLDILRRRLSRSRSSASATDEQLRDWPAEGSEADQLETLVRRGTQLFVLYTGGAANYFTHPRQFFDGYGPAARSNAVEFHYWRECDHLFFRPKDRERLIACLGRWLNERFGATS